MTSSGAVRWWWKQLIETQIPLSPEAMNELLKETWKRAPATPIQALMEARPHEEPEESESERTEREEGAAWKVREAMLVLTDAEWIVVVFRNHLHLSFDEIASYLDKPKTTIYYQWHRALEKMREVLEGDDE